MRVSLAAERPRGFFYAEYVNAVPCRPLTQRHRTADPRQGYRRTRRFASEPVAVISILQFTILLGWNLDSVTGIEVREDMPVRVVRIMDRDFDALTSGIS